MNEFAPGRSQLLPASAELRHTIWLGCWFALAKLLLHVVSNAWGAHLGYGFHRDELYYLICGRQLAWGYVDQAPLVAVQARVAEVLFGHSVTGIRLFSALAGAAQILLTGLLTWQLGGRRAAQALAMLCVLVAPEYIGLDSFLSMNSFEPVFWLLFVIVILHMQRGAGPHWWLVAAAIAGIGLLNKPSMLFFIAPVLVALLVSPQRRLLRSRYFAVAVLLTLLIVLPYLLWEDRHDWATWRYLRIDKLSDKYAEFDILELLKATFINLMPLSAPVWFGGLLWLLRDPRRLAVRWVGVMFLLFFALMAAMGSKEYYLAPVYTILFAAGGVLWEDVFRHARLIRWSRPVAALYTVAAVVWIAILFPMRVPVVAPGRWAVYLQLTGQEVGRSEKFDTSILPQFFADRFGWDELAAQMRTIVAGLPPGRRDNLGILCDNYGEASAINFFDRGTDVPFAISSHNNYFLWGTHGYTGENLLLVTGQTEDDLRKTYASVTPVGSMHNSLAMPYEHKTIYLASGRRRHLQQDWPSLRFYY